MWKTSRLYGCVMKWIKYFFKRNIKTEEKKNYQNAKYLKKNKIDSNENLLRSLIRPTFIQPYTIYSLKKSLKKKELNSSNYNYKKSSVFFFKNKNNLPLSITKYKRFYFSKTSLHNLNGLNSLNSLNNNNKVKCTPVLNLPTINNSQAINNFSTKVPSAAVSSIRAPSMQVPPIRVPPVRVPPVRVPPVRVPYAANNTFTFKPLIKNPVKFESDSSFFVKPNEFSNIFSKKNYDTRLTLGDVRYSINYDEKLGEGSYAKVYGGKIVSTEEKCAIRIINNLIYKTKEDINDLKTELHISLYVKHPNIVKIYHYEQDYANTIYVMEYCETNLNNYVNEYNYLNESISFHFFSQLALAVKYLHNNNIIHRDIKLENILIKSRKTLKICLTDFGFSRFWNPSPNKIKGEKCGTAYYASPQLFSTDTYDGQKNDIWAMTVCLFHMVTGTYPFLIMAERGIINLNYIYETLVKKKD